MFQTISTLDEWLHVPYISLLLYHARVDLEVVRDGLSSLSRIKYSYRSQGIYSALDETTFLKVNFVLVYTSWSKKRELEIKIKYGY